MVIIKVKKLSSEQIKVISKDKSFDSYQKTSRSFDIMKEKGTEAPFSGELLHNTKKGEYKCANCRALLFDSKAKFDSGTGWPSFDNAKNVELVEDNNNFMKRIEVKCKKCGSHLGHLFNDGPTKSGKRYCINSCALDFKEKKK